jgi:hypothetical protein
MWLPEIKMEMDQDTWYWEVLKMYNAFVVFPQRNFAVPKQFLAICTPLRMS